MSQAQTLKTWLEPTCEPIWDRGIKWTNIFTSQFKLDQSNHVKQVKFHKQLLK